MRQIGQQTRDPVDKTVLNNATQQLKRKIQRINNETIGEYLSKLTADNNSENSVWKATKRLKRPFTQNHPIRNADGSWARNNIQKAARFAEHLENTFQPHDGNDLNLIEVEHNDIIIKHVSPKKVTLEIKRNINSKKAPGFDLITGEVLKQFSRKAIVKLTYLII